MNTVASPVTRPAAQSIARPWVTAVWAALSAALFLGICLYLSHRRILWSDEALALNLIRDPSLHHAFESWSRGVDGGGWFFYLTGRAILAITGPHPFALRLFSAGCLWASAFLWWIQLRRNFSALAAVAGVASVWLTSSDYIDQVAQIRFYGLLMLAATVTVTILLNAERGRVSTASLFLLCAVSNAVLVSTHMLGVVFSTCIGTCLLFSRMPVRRRMVAVTGFLAGWCVLIPMLPAIRSGATALNWVLMPDLAGLLRYILHFQSPSRAFNAAVLLLIAICIGVALRRSLRMLAHPDERRLLLIVSGLLMLLPPGLYVASHVYKPLLISRYFMPYGLGLSALFACSLWIIETRPSVVRRPGARNAGYAALLILIAGLFVWNLRTQWIRPYSDIAAIEDLPAHDPVVVSDITLFMEVQSYTRNGGPTFIFPLPDDPAQQKKFPLLMAVAHQGYNPVMMQTADLLSHTPRFVYVDVPGGRYFYDAFLRGNPAFTDEDVGVIQVRGQPAHVHLFRRR